MSGLLVASLAVALVVGVTIGGSSTDVAFGPTVGSGVIGKLGAGVLMGAFALLGGWTVGRNVVATVGTGITGVSFGLLTGVIVLGIIGAALGAGALVGVPISTSMITVAAMAGMGLARGDVHTDMLAEIIAWWAVAPLLAGMCGVLYARRRSLAAWIPLPELNHLSHLHDDDRWMGAVVLVVACYMAFSAGASNVANAVGPLVGSGSLAMNPAIILAGGGIAVGAVTLARRTLDTVGGGLASLPLKAALFVTVTAATFTTILSWLGIPVSLALTTITCIAGYGWTRSRDIRTDGGPRDHIAETVRRGGHPAFHDHVVSAKRFDTATAVRIAVVWACAPAVAGLASFVVFTSVV